MFGLCRGIFTVVGPVVPESGLFSLEEPRRSHNTAFPSKIARQRASVPADSSRISDLRIVLLLTVTRDYFTPFCGAGRRLFGGESYIRGKLSTSYLLYLSYLIILNKHFSTKLLVTYTELKSATPLIYSQFINVCLSETNSHSSRSEGIRHKAVPSHTHLEHLIYRLLQSVRELLINPPLRASSRATLQHHTPCSVTGEIFSSTR